MALRKSDTGKNSKTKCTKKINNSKGGPQKVVKQRKPKAKPVHQSVHKTIVGHKVKMESTALEVPRLFRVDRLTGLPLDYEQTVDYVMHYVNPHLVHKRSPEQLLEEKLTQMFASLMEQQRGYGCGMSRSLIRHKLMSQLRSKGGSTLTLAKANREGNMELNEFHTACKRGPKAQSETYINSRKSKGTKYNPYKL
ncbi:uncharacterized protein Dwil_GK24610 [Drosophila willistoni]|uniref:Uncharacterized protein n=1 Tax=Drosophila willistoni TaxID=7260 RepID=B4N0N4_DROWI|nr:uncharacterized protein LOC6644338 [Drosophila willistoni]EDW77647.2 uncharacterized protein Dwil_GK24610 [Drosophila willistoni]